MKITIVEYDDLPESVKKRIGIPSSAQREMSYLRVEFGCVVEYHSGAMSTEHALFHGDVERTGVRVNSQQLEEVG